MGADLYWERSNWKQRQPKAVSTKRGNLAIMVDTFYQGYRKKGTVKDTPEVRKALLLVGCTIDD